MDLSLKFLGAAQNVTGSRFLLQANGYKVLIDCGMYQERQFRDRNWLPFPTPPAEIDAVILTHAHLDHCGWLPKLVKDGFNGSVYCTQATAEIARIVLLDSAKLQVEDAAYKAKRHKKEGRKSKFPETPLYNVEDAQKSFSLFAPIKYEQPTIITDGIKVVFHDAGHILGASMVKITVTHQGQKKTILFSGDIGRWDKPILRDPTLFDQADYVVIESTYGDRLHKDGKIPIDLLADVINSTRKAGGNIIIPSSAIERAQEVLYYLNELLLDDKIPPMMAFLDSPMAVRVTEVFNKHTELFDEEMQELIRQNDSPFDFPGLSMSRSTNQSKAINQIRGTAIIIAGSGMCTGGRVKHHLANNISRHKSTILFVGYQAFGTLGRIILEGAKEVRIHGKIHKVKARIARINGFSGHADRDELFRWLSNLKSPPRNVFVVHGETKSANSFAKFVKEKTGWNTSVPAYGDHVNLD